MGKFVDLTGNKYGRLTVIKRIETDRREKVKWLCQCDCGNLHTTISHSLTHGLCQSLRICNSKENIRNSSTQKRNKLGAKGVSITHSNTYQAQIQVDGKLKYLGSYKTIKEAADAYDLAAQKYFGEFARLNNYIESSI